MNTPFFQVQIQDDKGNWFNWVSDPSCKDKEAAERVEKRAQKLGWATRIIKTPTQ